MDSPLLEFKDGVVYLQRKDGVRIGVPFDRLSKADQDFVRPPVAPGSKQENPFSRAAEKADPAFEIDRAAAALCEQIGKNYPRERGGAKPKIAVVEFSDLGGNVTELGRLLSEELITKLFSTGKYNVVERSLLKKVIDEHKLVFDGIAAADSAKQLGKILGVSGVVSGTIGQVGDTLRVNARLISTPTGEILSVGAVTLPKDVEVAGRPRTKRIQQEPRSEEGQLVFHEDFSTYQVGDLPDWGEGVHVGLGEDGRKWLVADDPGMLGAGKMRPVGKNVSFPDDSWYLEFDFTAQVGKERNASSRGFVTSSISLVDEDGKTYRIGWQMYARKHVFVLADGTTHESELGSTVPAHGSTRENARYWLKGRTLRIAKQGDTLKLSIDGKPAFSTHVKGISRFVRFEVEAYKSTYQPTNTYYGVYLYFTNFKVARL